MAIDDLEREIDRALRRLPPVRAPRTLAPRVLRAIAAGVLPAGAPAGWRTWPLPVRMLAFVCACTLLVTIALGVPLAAIWIRDAAAARAAAALWDLFAAPVVAPAIAAVAAMCTAVALIVAALKHVAWEGQWTAHS